MLDTPRPDTTALIAGIRAASRSLVRGFGFMSRGIAGTELSASATHAILEIGFGEGVTARDLSQRLRLEKSSVSRLIRSLERQGAVSAHPDPEDGRLRRLALTEAGWQIYARIDRFAQEQVADALARLPAGAAETVLAGLDSYARALTGDAAEPARIRHGYTPGLGARIVEIGVLCMNAEMGFSRAFETRLLGDMAAFLPRMDAPRSRVWRAEIGGAIVGSITIDGEHLGDGIAHLRWFVMSPEIQGRGLGRQLIDAALAFCDAEGFRETHLWTVKGLDKARKLYDRTGFQLVDEWQGDQWGSEITEQKFLRPHPDHSKTHS